MTAHLCAHPGVCSAPPKLGGTTEKWGGTEKNFFPALRAGICAPPTFNLLSAPLSLPYGGLGTTYDVHHLELIGKRAGDFLKFRFDHDFTFMKYPRCFCFIGTNT